MLSESTTCTMPYPVLAKKSVLGSSLISNPAVKVSPKVHTDIVNLDIDLVTATRTLSPVWRSS